MNFVWFTVFLIFDIYFFILDELTSTPSAVFTENSEEVLPTSPAPKSSPPTQVSLSVEKESSTLKPPKKKKRKINEAKHNIEGIKPFS